MSAVRILLADDHPLVRRGLRALLEGQPGWEVCGEAATGREALEKVKRLRPDVVVLDIMMPELNGLDATRLIRKEAPRTEVLVLTMDSSEAMAREVLRAGARGYVLKSDADTDLVAAVIALRQHKPFLTSRVAEFVLERYVEAATDTGQGTPSRCTLTTREREIVQLLAEGKGNKEIAARLDVSTRTVEAHRANPMRKLGVRSLSELVHYAIRNKLVEA